MVTTSCLRHVVAAVLVATMTLVSLAEGCTPGTFVANTNVGFEGEYPSVSVKMVIDIKSCAADASAMDVSALITNRFRKQRPGTKNTPQVLYRACKAVPITWGQNGVGKFPTLSDPFDCWTDMMLLLKPVGKTLKDESIQLTSSSITLAGPFVGELPLKPLERPAMAASLQSGTYCAVVKGDDKPQEELFAIHLSVGSNSFAAVHSANFSAFPADAMQCDSVRLSTSAPAPWLRIGMGGNSNSPCDSCISRMMQAHFGQKFCAVLEPGQAEGELMVVPATVDTMRTGGFSPMTFSMKACANGAKPPAQATYCGTYAGTPEVKITMAAGTDDEGNGQEDSGSALPQYTMSVQLTTTGFGSSCEGVTVEYNATAAFGNVSPASPSSVGAQCLDKLMGSVGRTPWHALQYVPGQDVMWLTIQTGAAMLTRC